MTFANSYKLKFVNKNGSVKEVEAEEGKSVLDVAHKNNIDIEGACESSCACSTCHIILEE
jgi:ferredoxin